ncbi:MAG: hypothetical protein WD431_14155, partial [Cyclobacteriaceae bacterium]
VNAGLSQINTLADGKVYLGNLSNEATEVTISGDVNLSNAGVSTIGASKVVSLMIADGTIVTADFANDAVTTAKILDANVTSSKIADGSVTTGKILEGTVINEDVSATAAIAGTKINPIFGAQNISTTGTITTGAITLPNTDGTSGQVLTTDGAGLTSWGTAGANVMEVADEFMATGSQTSFTLTQAPSANSKVKMYINGIRISNTAYSVSETTLTYDPANNGSYALIAGDRIQMDFYY